MRKVTITRTTEFSAYLDDEQISRLFGIQHKRDTEGKAAARQELEKIVSARHSNAMWERFDISTTTQESA